MPNEAEPADRRPDAPRSDPARRQPVTLESTLVRHERGPDRRTVYPPRLSEVARMSTWLSADSDAFVDLDAAR